MVNKIEKWNDKIFVLETVKISGASLKYASEELRNDKEVVLEAVRQKGDYWTECALEYASEGLKNDKEVVIEAVKKNGGALEYASEKLRDDKFFVLEAVNHMGWGDLLGYSYCECPELGAETIKKLGTVKETDGALRFISERLQNDRDVASEVFKIVSEMLRNYRSRDTNNAPATGVTRKTAVVLTHDEMLAIKKAGPDTSLLGKIYSYMILIGIFLAIVYIWLYPLFSNSGISTSDCRNTTRSVQTIVKVDGAVDSVETETVDGCETSDGTFYKRPDF